MSKFKFYFIVLAGLSVLFSCDDKKDAQDYEILHAFDTQYEYDLSVIEQYLQSHYIEEIIDNPGQPDDQDIKLTLIPQDGTQESIWESDMLKFIEVERHDITYKIYYIQQREGVGEAPSRVDRVFASYDGGYLRLGEEPTRFEYVQNPTAYLPLHSTIFGWSEIFRLFKDGTLMDTGEGNPAAYENFGAGVMFIPSGLAYFNQATSTIPPYAQLMFKFKLYDVKRDDQDGDGILSNDEDLNNDGIFTNDDTDSDGIVNFLDTDDDGDGYLTINETKYRLSLDADPFQTTYFYPYDGAAEDDPATPINETYGIPRKFTGPSELIPGTTDKYWNKPAADGSDFTDPSRLRRHLDKTATPPYYDYQ